jgi:hypothetical protein
VNVLGDVDECRHVGFDGRGGEEKMGSEEDVGERLEFSKDERGEEDELLASVAKLLQVGPAKAAPRGL